MTPPTAKSVFEDLVNEALVQAIATDVPRRAMNPRRTTTKDGRDARPDILRPGYLIGRLSQEKRDALKELTSDIVKNYSPRFYFFYDEGKK